MKQSIDRREFGLGTLATSAAIATAGRPALALAVPVKIRVGWVVVPASIAPLVLEKKDILKHFGQSYIAEATADRDQYRDPNGTPNLGALQSNLQKQKRVGFLKDDIDVKKYSDVSIVEEAAKRLT